MQHKWDKCGIILQATSSVSPKYFRHQVLLLYAYNKSVSTRSVARVHAVLYINHEKCSNALQIRIHHTQFKRICTTEYIHVAEYRVCAVPRFRSPPAMLLIQYLVLHGIIIGSASTYTSSTPLLYYDSGMAQTFS